VSTDACGHLLKGYARGELDHPLLSHALGRKGGVAAVYLKERVHGYVRGALVPVLERVRLDDTVGKHSGEQGTICLLWLVGNELFGPGDRSLKLRQPRSAAKEHVDRVFNRLAQHLRMEAEDFGFVKKKKGTRWCPRPST
jgi:hypothetical protein